VVNSTWDIIIFHMIDFDQFFPILFTALRYSRWQ